MSSLSQEDANALDAMGHSMILMNVCLVVDAILYTVYFFCVIVSGRILLLKRCSKAYTAMFILIFMMFLLDTTVYILDIHNAINKITLFTSISSIPLSDRSPLSDYLPRGITKSLTICILVLGDIISFWRAYACWNNYEERWILIIPAIPLIGTFTVSGMAISCWIEKQKITEMESPSFCHIVPLEPYVMVLFTTATSTVLIFYRIWLFRKDIRALGGWQRKYRVEKVMMVLVKCEILYFLFCLAFAISSIGQVSGEMDKTYSTRFARKIWDHASSHILGIFPALTVIIVNSQHSPLDQTISISLDSRSSNINNNLAMDFAAPTNASDDERIDLDTTLQPPVARTINVLNGSASGGEPSSVG